MNHGGVKKEVRAEDLLTELLPLTGTQRPRPELLSHSLSITMWAGGQCGSLSHIAVPFYSLSWSQQTVLDQKKHFFSCTCYHRYKGFTFCKRPVDHLAWFKKKIAQLQQPSWSKVSAEEITICFPGLCPYAGKLIYPEKHFFLCHSYLENIIPLPLYAERKPWLAIWKKSILLDIIKSHKAVMTFWRIILPSCYSKIHERRTYFR